MKEYICINERINGENIYILFHHETATIIPVNKILYELFDAYNKNKNIKPILVRNKIKREHFFETKNKISNSIKNSGKKLIYGLYQGLDFRTLSQLRLNIAGDCNLACKYCYANYGKYNTKSTGMMTKDTVTNCLYKMTKIFNRIEKIAFFGGEPLLNPNIIEYTINYIENELKQKQQITYSMDTNGTINIKKKFLEKLTVFVSVDGPRKYHDKFRRTKDNKPTYNTIKNNLANIKEELHGFNYGIQCTVTQEMFNDNIKLEDVYNILYKDFFPTKISLNPAAIVKNFKLDLSQFYKIGLDALFDLYDREYFIGDESIIQLIYMIIKGVKTDYICPAGTKSLTISYNGDIYPCHLLMKDKYKITNVNKFTLEEIKKHLAEFNTKYGKMFMHTDKKCQDCWMKNFCMGCIAKFKLGETKDPNFCKTSKELFRHLLIRLAQLKTNKISWAKFLKKIQERSIYENQ